MNNGKRITLATIKAFIRKNADTLHVLNKSKFDGMTDGCESTGEKAFSKALPSDRPDCLAHDLGIHGVWFVGSSRDHFTVHEENGFRGYSVFNCCGSFVLAAPA